MSFISDRKVFAAFAAGSKHLTAKPSMFALEVCISFLGHLRKHAPAACPASMRRHTSLTEFYRSILGVFDKLSRKDRWSLSISQNGDRLSSSSKCNVKQASFLRVVVFLGLRKNEVQKRVIDNLGWETHATG